MSARYLTLSIAALLIASCGKPPPADPNRLESYAAKLAVNAEPGAPLQRMAVPAAALIEMQNADLSDIRVFDAGGKSLPISLLRGEQIAQAEEKRIEVKVYPVVGSVEALRVRGISLSIDDGKVAHIVGLDGPTGAAKAQVVGTLLDTREVTDPAIAVVLNADLPVQQPVTVTLESSADLKNWELLGEKVMFHSALGGVVLGSGRIELPSADLRGRYIRVGWAAAGMLLEPVAVRSAAVITSKRGPPQRPVAQSSGVEQIGAHDLRLTLPFKAPIAGLKLSQSSPDGVVPVRLYGKASAELPWTMLAAGTVRSGRAGASILETGDAAMALYRIEADQRTAGFAQPPEVDLLFDPVELLIRFSGNPPYIVGAGLAGAPGTFLTPEEIEPGASQRLAGIPQATYGGGQAAAVSVAPAPAARGLADKRLVLWLVLLAGVAVLGLALARLLKGSAGKGDAGRDDDSA